MSLLRIGNILLLTTISLAFIQFSLVHQQFIGPMQSSVDESFQNSWHSSSRCAINLFGLPRAFQALVLPSLIQNVIQVNAQYHCDYFVHYYHVQNEREGRSGGGGTIDPSEIRLLQKAVERAGQPYNHKFARKQTVAFVYDTEQTFWEQYTPLIHKIRTENDTLGRWLYFPWKARTYKYPDTTDNIIKMWHSIQQVYTFMKESARQQSYDYTRVAMLRSDVVYATPLDVYHINSTHTDRYNTHATIPGFGRFPINDRSIYGPSKAVELWATQRFAKLDEHVQWVLRNDPGWGLHEERFLYTSIFPLIRRAGITIMEHDTLCFFRARADRTVWISDCSIEAAPSIVEHLGTDPITAVEKAIGRKCGPRKKLTQRFVYTNCSA